MELINKLSIEYSFAGSPVMIPAMEFSSCMYASPFVTLICRSDAAIFSNVPFGSARPSVRESNCSDS